MFRALAFTTLVAACGGGDPPVEEPLFPADYAATYTQVRDCRRSIDHDLVNMRIVAAPDALDSYLDRLVAFPEGAIVLKEEFDGSDMDCTGTIIGFTVMRKLAAGTAPEDLDWEWQETDRTSKPVQTDLQRCIQCHTGCGVPAEGGFDGTCAQE
jgi:hypothetical protein